MIIKNIFIRIQNQYRHKFMIGDCQHCCLVCKYFETCINDKG